MTYEWIAELAGSAGLLYAMGLFAIVLVYALRPRNKARFEHASRIPLDDDEPRPLEPTRGSVSEREAPRD